MKHVFCILLFLTSCGNKEQKSSNTDKNDLPKIGKSEIESFTVYTYKNNVRDRNIKNTSDKQIDLLFNSVENYFGGHKDSNVSFSLEFCMECEPLVEYNNGLLFNKRLLITQDKIKYYKIDVIVPEPTNKIKLIRNQISNFDDLLKFKFNDGNGLIKYQGISCNDANFNKVELRFKKGKIILDSLINAAYFEYDLNKDGHKELYLLGSRNCSKEVIFLRIAKVF